MLGVVYIKTCLFFSSSSFFQEPGGIKWVIPASVEQDWFNLFTIHQNREARGIKNYIKNEYLPKFLDLIVWGHEHKSCPEPEEFDDFHILQLGSTVQTDLSEDESLPKHCVLLEINDKRWRTHKYELQRVRPFCFERVVLKNVISQSHWTEETISEILMSKVETIASQIKEKMKSQGQDPVLPLVRLRVDYTGFTTINIQRFGSKLVGKVANPKETLLFVKSKAQSRRKDGSMDMVEGSHDLDLLFDESENQVLYSVKREGGREREKNFNKMGNVFSQILSTGRNWRFDKNQSIWKKLGNTAREWI